MRILRLDFGPDIGSADLHPFISVVHGLDEARASRLMSAIRSLVSGSGHGLAGLVEHQGHLVEVTPTTIGGLGPFTTEDIMLAVDRLAGGADTLPALLAELDQLTVAARIDSVWVEEVRADLVPSAAARVQQLRDRIDGKSVVTIDLEVRRLRDTVRRAIAGVDDTPRTLSEVPPEIAGLLIDLEAYRDREHRSEGHLEALARRVQVGEASLADSLRFLADAESDAKPVLLSPEDEDRLEELSHPRVERRFLARDKSSDHDEEVAALLAKVNQPTYSSYAMYRLSPTAPPEKLAVVEAARSQVVAAQIEVEEARAALSADSDALEIAAQFESIKERARALFGPMLPSDLDKALRSHVVERPNPEWLDRTRGLYDALAEAEVEVPDTLEPEQLPIWADDWLIQQERADQEAGYVDPTVLQSQLDAAEAALDRHVRAMARIDRLEAKAADSRQRVGELERRIERINRGELSAVESVYEGIVTLTEKVRSNSGVSIPVVVKGNFGDLTDQELSDLFDRVEPLAQSVQLVVMTDRNAAAAWARAAGARRALCAGTAG